MLFPLKPSLEIDHPAIFPFSFAVKLLKVALPSLLIDQPPSLWVHIISPSEPILILLAVNPVLLIFQPAILPFLFAISLLNVATPPFEMLQL